MQTTGFLSVWWSWRIVATFQELDILQLMRWLIIWHGFTSQRWRNVLLNWALFLAKFCWICKKPCKWPPEKKTQWLLQWNFRSISTPRSKLREHHLLSRMVLDPITISSNAYPVHSMVKNSKENQNYSIGSIHLPLAVNWSVSLKRKKGEKTSWLSNFLSFCTKRGRHS